MKNKVIAIYNSLSPMSELLSHDSLPQIIGMVHVLSNNILLRQNTWCKNLNLPLITKEDFEYIRQLNDLYETEKVFIKKKFNLELLNNEYDGVIVFSEKIDSLYDILSKLTFTDYLVKRAMQEVDCYLQNGVKIIQLENVGAPYFVRAEIPIVDRVLMSYISSKIRDKYPDLPMGIQILAFGDNIALEIALRYKMHYVRGESFLFKGLRPEGEVSGSGNLAKAYLARNYFSLFTNKENNFPKIYPDLRKKHTIFNGELTELKTWLDNLVFLKIEGAIITGKHTGSPVEQNDMLVAKESINKVYNDFGISIPLLSGSGANIENIAEYSKFFNGIILGSYQKTRGYWENPIEPERLAKFMKIFSQITMKKV